MDPSATLENIRRLAEIVREERGTTQAVAIAADELAEQIQALDEWIMKSGFLPADWRQS